MLLKIYNLFLFYCTCVNITIHSSLILCSIKDKIRTDSIDLTYSQQYSLDILLCDIYPRYELTTYFIDPIKKYKCYIFIENKTTYAIKHYTLILNDNMSYEDIKKIFYVFIGKSIKILIYALTI